MSRRGHSRPARSFRHKIDCSAETVIGMAKVTRTLIGSRVVSTGAVLDEFGECFSVKLGDDMSPPHEKLYPRNIYICGSCRQQFGDPYMFLLRELPGEKLYP